MKNRVLHATWYERESDTQIYKDDGKFKIESAVLMNNLENATINCVLDRLMMSEHSGSHELGYHQYQSVFCL